MQRFYSVTMAFVLSAFGLALPASAQTQQSIMPQGNWQATCRSVIVKGSTLSAQCVMRNGLWQRSSIDVNTCPSLLIANKNGTLACEVIGGGGGGNPPNFYPPGPWQSTCKNFTMRGQNLTASCMDASGSFRTTTLNVSRCPNRLVANVNGILLCQP